MKMAAVLAAFILAGPAAAQDGAAYEAALLSSPTYRPLFEEMKKHFPDTWNELIAESMQRLSAGQTPAQLEVYRRDYLQRFQQALRPSMRKAPSAQIAEYAKANAEFMKALKGEDVAACAAIVAGQPAPAGAAEKFKEATVRAYVLAQAAMVRAAKAGADKPTEHSPPTPQDDAIVAAFMREAGGQVADVRLVGVASAPLSPRQRCDAGVGWAVATTKATNAVIARQLNRNGR